MNEKQNDKKKYVEKLKLLAKPIPVANTKKLITSNAKKKGIETL